MPDDIWFDEFQRRTTPRLKLIFEKDLSTMPKVLIDKIEELRRIELQLMARKGK